MRLKNHICVVFHWVSGVWSSIWRVWWSSTIWRWETVMEVWSSFSTERTDWMFPRLSSYSRVSSVSSKTTMRYRRCSLTVHGHVCTSSTFITRRFLIFQVIRKSKCLDEVLAKMDPQAANNHFNAIKKWKSKRERVSPRGGAFLLYSRKKLAKLKAQSMSQELTNGREQATLQVTKRSAGAFRWRIIYTVALCDEWMMNLLVAFGAVEESGWVEQDEVFEEELSLSRPVFGSSPPGHLLWFGIRDVWQHCWVLFESVQRKGRISNVIWLYRLRSVRIVHRSHLTIIISQGFTVCIYLF